MELSREDYNNGYVLQQQLLHNGQLYDGHGALPTAKSWSSTCPRRKRDMDLLNSKRRNSMSDMLVGLNPTASPPLVRCSGNGQEKGVSFCVPNGDNDVTFIRSPGRRTSTFRPCLVGGSGTSTFGGVERSSQRSRSYVYSVQDAAVGDDGPYYFKLDPTAVGDNRNRRAGQLLSHHHSFLTHQASRKPDVVRQSCVLCSGSLTEDTDSTNIDAI